MKKQLLVRATVDNDTVSADTLYIPVGGPGDKLGIAEAISAAAYVLERDHAIVVPDTVTYQLFSSYAGHLGTTLVGYHKTESERDDLLAEIDFMWGVPFGEEEIE